MNESFSLTVQPRTLFGKKTGQLRRQNLLPANIFGAGEESVAVTVQASAFKKLYQEAGETSLIYITIEGEKKNRPVLVEAVDADPITGTVLHVSFKQVNLKEKITAEIPVEVVGEVSVPDSTVVVTRDVIEVEALPTDLPEKFEVDVSKFTKVGQEVTFAQLDYDRTKVELQIPAEEMDQPVVMLQAFVEQAEPEPVTETIVGDGAAEGEAGAEGAAEGGAGEKPAEGGEEKAE
jgi:large subunit ribosomal protein L25